MGTRRRAGGPSAPTRPTPEAQERWRWALRYALHGRDDSGDGTRILVHLAVLVRAYGVLDALPGLLIVGDVTRFDLVFQAASALAGQTTQGIDCLERIRVSPAFDENYAGHTWNRRCRRLSACCFLSSTAMARYARAVHAAVAPGRADMESARGWLRREWDAMPRKLAESA